MQTGCCGISLCVADAFKWQAGSSAGRVCSDGCSLSLPNAAGAAAGGGAAEHAFRAGHRHTGGARLRAAAARLPGHRRRVWPW